MARARPRPPSRAARRLLPQLQRVVWLAQRADARAAARRPSAPPRSSACRSRSARPATPGSKPPSNDSWRRRRADQRTAALRDPRRGLDAGARPRLAPDRLRARDRVPARRGARRASEQAGQKVEGQLVKFDPDWILEQVAKAPREFDLQARNPERTRSTSAASTWCSRRSTAARSCATGSSGARRRTPTSRTSCGSRRRSRSSTRRAGRSASRTTSRSTRATSTWSTRCMTLSDKPFMGSVTSGPNARGHDRDGRDGLRPRVDRGDARRSISLINVNSPLRYDDRMLAALLEYAKANQADDHHAVPADGRDVAGLASPSALAQQVGRGARRDRARADDPARAAPSSSARSSRTPTCSRARRASARRSRRSACSAPARSRGTTGCRSAAAAA